MESASTRRDGVSREDWSASAFHQTPGEGSHVAVVRAAAAAEHILGELVPQRHDLLGEPLRGLGDPLGDLASGVPSRNEPLPLITTLTA